MRIAIEEIQTDFIAVSQKARSEPVIVTDGGEDSLVVLTVEEWMRLRRGERRVGLASELPEEWIEAVRKAEVPAEYAILDEELR